MKPRKRKKSRRTLNQLLQYERWSREVRSVNLRNPDNYGRKERHEPDPEQPLKFE